MVVDVMNSLDSGNLGSTHLQYENSGVSIFLVTNGSLQFNIWDLGGCISAHFQDFAELKVCLKEATVLLALFSTPLVKRRRNQRNSLKSSGLVLKLME